MQIIFIPRIWAIALAFVLWGIFQTGAALLSLKIPARSLDPDSFYFRSRSWEQGGAFYDKVFLVKRWKKFLPDGGAALGGGYAKKNLSDFSTDNLNFFLVYSCRAEVTHIMAIFPFWVFGLFVSWQVVVIMFIYALVANIPCVIVQRYNRPRIAKLLKIQARRKTGKA